MNRSHDWKQERGTALLAAVLLVMLLSAAGLGLALTAGLEPSIARNFEAEGGALNAAEAGLVLAAHDVARAGDWTAVLRGELAPTVLEPAADGAVVITNARPFTLAALTNLTNCGREDSCSPEEAATVTTDRPWGHNNPRFRLLGMTHTSRVSDRAALMPFRVVVWVGDDAAEIDGDPETDGGPGSGEPLGRSPGLGCLVLRAESFGLRGAHAVLQATLERGEVGRPPRLREWTLQ